jgi:hypothetical protein
MMIALNQQEKQVVESFRQLQPQRRRYVLLEMTRADAEAWKQFRAKGEARLREAAHQKALDWDAMDDQQRQDFVEAFLDSETA